MRKNIIQKYLNIAEECILYRLNGGDKQPPLYWLFEENFEKYENLNEYYRKLQYNSFSSDDEEKELWEKAILEVAGSLV